MPLQAYQATDSGYSLKVAGKDAPILGRICMDQLLLDVSGIDCKIGDTVTVFDGEHPHTAKDLAAANDTIAYEIICSVGRRVPRAFVKNGEISYIGATLYTNDTKNTYDVS